MAPNVGCHQADFSGIHREEFMTPVGFV